MSGLPAVRRVRFPWTSPAGIVLEASRWEIVTVEDGGDSVSPPLLLAPTCGVLFLAGFNHYMSPFYDWLAARLAPAGIACYGLDFESFGRSVQDGRDPAATRPRHPVRSRCEGDVEESAGRRVGGWGALLCGTAGGGGGGRCLSYGCRGRLRAYVPVFDDIVRDARAYAEGVVAPSLGPGVPLFLHGESMGGGVSIRLLAGEGVSEADAGRGSAEQLFAGAILVSPMARLNTATQPPLWLQAIGSCVAALVPWAPIAPVSDIASACFKDPVKLAEVLAGTDPLRYMGRMRLGTALQLRDAAAAVQRAVPLIPPSTPILIQQGSVDAVTPGAGQHVFDHATRCGDRTLVLYENAWHALFAEPVDTRRSLVLDTLAWLGERVPAVAEALDALRAEIAGGSGGGGRAAAAAAGAATVAKGRGARGGGRSTGEGKIGGGDEERGLRRAAAKVAARLEGAAETASAALPAMPRTRGGEGASAAAALVPQRRPEGKGPFRDGTVWSASQVAVGDAVRATVNSHLIRHDA